MVVVKDFFKEDVYGFLVGLFFVENARALALIYSIYIYIFICISGDPHTPETNILGPSKPTYIICLQSASQKVYGFVGNIIYYIYKTGYVQFLGQSNKF